MIEYTPPFDSSFLIPLRSSCYNKISSIVSSIYSTKNIKSEMGSYKSQPEKRKSTNLPPINCLVPNKKRKISLTESFFYNAKEPMSNKVSYPVGPRNQVMGKTNSLLKWEVEIYN